MMLCLRYIRLDILQLVVHWHLKIANFLFRSSKFHFCPHTSCKSKIRSSEEHVNINASTCLEHFSVNFFSTFKVSDLCQSIKIYFITLAPRSPSRL